MVRILLADDHKLLRDGLRPLLVKVHPQARVIEANDFHEALTVAEAAGGVNLALLDLHMPGMEGVTSLGLFMERFPTARVVLLSAFAEPETVLAAIKAGAAGFIPKTIGGKGFIHALRLILAGETYVPTATLLEVNRKLPESSPDNQTKTPLRVPDRQEFTDREREVMALLIDGTQNKVIARRLGLQEATVKACLRGLYRKLGAVNRAQAVKIILALDAP